MAKKPAPTSARTKSPKKIDDELAAAIAADAREPTQDELANIRRLASEMRDAEIVIEELEERKKKLRDRIEEIKWHDLLDAMDKAGMRAMTLEGEGNLPAYEVRTGAYYHANIPADAPDAVRAPAFAWLQKHEPGMLRNEIVLSFGKDSTKQQKAVQAALQKLKVPYSNKFGVPWNTLTAYIKEQIEEHDKTPPLELLCAKVGRIATIKKVKEK
jgi:hypothetical protein